MAPNSLKAVNKPKKKQKPKKKKDWDNLEQMILSRRTGSQLNNVISSLEDRLEKFGDLQNVTIYNSPPPSSKKKKRKPRKKKKNKAKEPTQQEEQKPDEPPMDQIDEKDKIIAEAEKSQLNPSELSENYDNDSVPSNRPEEFLKPFSDGDSFIVDDVELDYLGGYVEVPIPTQSDFFVHKGGLSTFKTCTGYKKREDKLDMLRHNAEEQRKHETALIEAEKLRIRQEKEKIIAEKKEKKNARAKENLRLKREEYTRITDKLLKGEKITEEEREFYDKECERRKRRNGQRQKYRKSDRKKSTAPQQRFTSKLEEVKNNRIKQAQERTRVSEEQMDTINTKLK